MRLIPIVINSFANALLGAQVFDRVKAVVIRQDDKELSGEQKREAAIEELKLIGLDIAKWMINLAIELAVAYLRKLAA